MTTLMESLPPMDWHELATKTDLALLEERMDAKFEVVDVRLEALRTELGAKIDTGLTNLGARITTVDAKIDTGLTNLGARITTVDARIDKRIALQTYVILVGMAALVTPIYIALFTGAGG